MFLLADMLAEEELENTMDAISDLIEDEANATMASMTSSKESSSDTTNCPGCHPPADKLSSMLNSRNYNFSIENHQETCQQHRFIREKERDYIKGVKNKAKQESKENGGHKPVYFQSKNSVDGGKRKVMKSASSIYRFESSQESTDEMSSGDRHRPTEKEAEDYIMDKKHKQRRQRTPYSDQEVANLLDGVEKMGRSWNVILYTYQFHSSRTSTDLKDKYKQLVRQSNDTISMASECKRSRSIPFSMAEIRRLKRGVKKFGQSWTTILKNMNFNQNRTADQLRNKWRCMCSD